MATIESLVVVGASGSGKSTLVDGLRASHFERSVVIPRRFSTRLDRPGDNPQESEFIDRDSFEQRVRDGSLRPYWRRAQDIGQQAVLYGFEPPAPGDKRLRIYSANNAMLRDGNESVEETLATGLVVITAATQVVRAARLRQHAEAMSASEHDFRLNRDEDLIPINGSAEVINTTDLSVVGGQQRLQSLVIQILNRRDELEASA